MYENISEIYKKTFNFIYNNIDEDITKLILNKNKINRRAKNFAVDFFALNILTK